MNEWRTEEKTQEHMIKNRKGSTLEELSLCSDAQISSLVQNSINLIMYKFMFIWCESR